MNSLAGCFYSNFRQPAPDMRLDRLVDFYILAKDCMVIMNAS